MKAVQLSPTGAVISIGSVKLDYTALLDPDLERKPVRAGKWLVSPGGKAANQAVAAARAGARVRLIGSIGDDDAGRKLLAFLRDNWIDIEQVRLNQGQPTGSSVVLVTPDGENSILRFPGATALLKPSAIQQMEIREQDIIMTHLGPPPGSGDCSASRCPCSWSNLNPERNDHSSSRATATWAGQHSGRQ